MADVQTGYGTTNQSITLSLNSLADDPNRVAGRQSTAVDNTSTLYLDVLVSVKVKTNAGALANDKACYVYAYGTTDDGTTYTDGASGSDGAITLSNPTNMPLLGVINTPASSTTYAGGPWSVAAAFGSLPAKFGVVLVNVSGQDLDASAGGSATFQGIYGSVA